MIHVDLPYDYGTFVKVKNEKTGNFDCGTIVAYMVSYDGWCVWVSGYKEAWCGEFLPEDIELMSQSEIDKLKKKYGE